VKGYDSDSQQTIKRGLYSFAVDVIPVNKPKSVKTVKNTSQKTEEQAVRRL